MRGLGGYFTHRNPLKSFLPLKKILKQGSLNPPHPLPSHSCPSNIANVWVHIQTYIFV
jgi:hypothetical protein